jgi:hypothetical protein
MLYHRLYNLGETSYNAILYLPHLLSIKVCQALKNWSHSLNGPKPSELYGESNSIPATFQIIYMVCDKLPLRITN